MPLGLVCLFFGLCVLSLGIGSQPLWQNTGFNTEQFWLTITASRVPRLLALILTGVGLSVCGVILQHIVRNKFVEPATSGGLDAAKLGILVAIGTLPHATHMLRMLSAILFCFLASLIYIAIIRRIRLSQQVLVPVIGLMYGSVLSAIAEFYAYQQQILQSMQTWLMGDFSRIVQGHYEMIYVILPIVILTYVYAQRFTIVAMGDAMSRSLGIHYAAIAALGLVLVAVTVGATVITVGAIPFIGLVVPNLVALRYGDHLKTTLPIIALSGASLLISCDIASRLILYPYEVPIGLTAGILGGIIFLLFILRGAQR
ncbi:iron ABC transporter permease [Acinetobacter larvae]|uniref:Iron ABC transporter permease n=1 Tax=Acinetobacter larvae TaxID=1789224 RepID=A0A1B2M429_9GAMM|nr:iron chelate uptake ABC transporter family permease subunit [Acinetobacter larvae]AOA59912.1 iron ABC transporter permease [Acinetobacter larvae]